MKPNWEKVRRAMFFKEVVAEDEGVRVLTLEERKANRTKPPEHCENTIDMFSINN